MIGKTLRFASTTLTLALALTTGGRADIVYSGPQDITLTSAPASSYGVTFTGDSPQIAFSDETAKGNPLLVVNGNGLGEFVVSGQPSALDANTLINSSSTFGESSGNYDMAEKLGTTGSDPWYGVQEKYLGVTFTEGSSTYYGWIELSVASNLDTTILGWAYQNTPGVGILAGDIGAQSVPEPSTMVMAAIAVGVFALVPIAVAAARPGRSRQSEVGREA
jgi:hypothetical protein